MEHHMRKLFCILTLLTFTDLASAGFLSFTGSLDPNNPNDVFITPFTLSSQANLNIQTWGFGGTAGAPGGANAAGAVILAGGFDPYVSLFTGTGNGATFLASNDDGLCPPGTPFLACADSTLNIANLAAGSYTLALTLPFNFSFAENQGSGTLGDGFIGLDASFSDGSCAGLCTNNFAVDITSAGIETTPPTQPAPAPGSLSLVFVGILAWGVLVFSRTGFAVRARA
jgi:hypothetical protein